MDVPTFHHRAVAGFGHRVGAIADEHWSRETPCTDWDVRALLAHLVEEDLWTPPLMAGRTIEDVTDEIPSDALGDDPKGAWEEASRVATDAVTDDVMEKTVHLSFGDVPGAEYAMQLGTDHLIHTWDLARAIGADERLDPELVDYCEQWFDDRESLYRGAGVIGERVEVLDDADAQTVLLARFGRKA